MNENTFFYFNIDGYDDTSKNITNDIELYAKEKQQQIYVIKRSLGNKKYTYDYDNALIILIPKHKIIFLNYGNNDDISKFNEFVEDFAEDLASISDKYEYKKIIGRTREWKEKIIYKKEVYGDNNFQFDEIFRESKLDVEKDKRTSKLLISLLIGSINNVEKFTDDIPNNVLDKIKQNIILFDSKQTEFIYQQNDSRRTVIQGLSGTGKTELLLHKLKDLYVNEKESKIAFTCYSKILANDLLHRIPDFFNFMKVEEQIKWNERLWCVHAWGSRNDKNSGIYRYICDYYKINFSTYYNDSDFGNVCENAIKEIKSQGSNEMNYAFDYIFIDESQDFNKIFFDLCEVVTKKKVYIAGDIFQSIFDKNIEPNIEIDFLLKKCYRTDPKTLMFAHGLGMGLFEKEKIRWLNEDGLKACGYSVEKQEHKLIIKREPINRFDDVDNIDNIDSIEIVKCNKERDLIIEKIINTMRQIAKEHTTVLPDDIAIMFPNDDNSLYEMFDLLDKKINEAFDWKVNKSYETKEKLKDHVFLSNRNNVKGLEFSFVICITTKLITSISFRNALYMMISRSFLKTYLLVIEEYNGDVLPNIEQALDEIKRLGQMSLEEPTDEEKKKIEERIIQYNSRNSIDIIEKICNDLKIPHKYIERIKKYIELYLRQPQSEDELKKKIEEFYTSILIGL
ncbi:MAG: AAA family ATPase [Campylobacteraceae bacterium]|jgi:superfamily I DNA and RNA helicase|nr:AAA family ATPase [Campylobacteraceae bacterium]